MRIDLTRIRNSIYREVHIMFEKILAIVLASLMINLVSMNPAYADSKEERQAHFVERVKKSIAKLGIGSDARVEIRLRDNTKLKGYISDSGEDAFVVIDAKTGAARTVTYPQVKQIKGNNLSEGVKIAIGVAVAIALVLIFASKGLD